MDLASGSMVNGNIILTSADETIQNYQCQEGEVLSYGSNGWSCSSFKSLLDNDEDGILSWGDCDDNNPLLLSKANDNDCDGSITSADCDDNDSNSAIRAEDADCDTIPTLEDCDDNDPSLKRIADDADCDGYITSDDCDDNDQDVFPGAEEVCNDSVDNDCDSNVDEDCSCNNPLWSIGGNWTENTDAYRSSQLSGSSYNATNTLDSDQGSFWLSNDGNIINEWIVYNLGSIETIEGVRFSNGQSPFSGKNVTIQKSDNLNGPWEDIEDILLSSDDVVWQEFTGFQATSQYFRLYFHDNYGSVNYIKIRDVQFAVCN